MSNIIEIQKQINTQVANKDVLNALVTTTFKGLEIQTMKRAMMEGMMRGFKFDDFLKKNVYAIPFKGGYSLVTSIDYARKIGMRNGIVGKSAPKFELDDDGKVTSCSITVQRKVGDHIGDYSATVFFDEYTTGRNLWVSKPKTMIAKVAEMHALRMACPEELSQAYIEEDVEQEVYIEDGLEEETKTEIDKIETVEALKEYYTKNKGRGKEFDRYVTARKNQLEQKDKNQDENTPDTPKKS